MVLRPYTATISAANGTTTNVVAINLPNKGNLVAVGLAPVTTLSPVLVDATFSQGNIAAGSTAAFFMPLIPPTWLRSGRTANTGPFFNAAWFGSIPLQGQVSVPAILVDIDNNVGAVSLVGVFAVVDE